MRAVQSGHVELCCSADIVAEYRIVAARRKFIRARTQIEELFGLISRARLFEPSASGYMSPDPKDTILIDCAVAADADFLVTGNGRDFPEPVYGRAEVVNARIFLDRIAASR